MEETKKLILIAEDDTPLLRAVQDKLSRAGFIVETAVDGGEALEKALRLHPDLVILDILMPKMSGLVVLERLREDEWGKHVPVFMLTNLDSVEKTSEAIAAGSLFYFVKSDHTLRELVEQVEKTLGK